MALSTVDKTMNLASRVVAASDQLLRALETFVALKDEKESAGVSFTDADFLAALPASSLKHVTGDLLNSVIGNGPAIYTAMKDGGTLQAFTDDAFQALRP